MWFTGGGGGGNNGGGNNSSSSNATTTTTNNQQHLSPTKMACNQTSGTSSSSTNSSSEYSSGQQSRNSLNQSYLFNKTDNNNNNNNNDNDYQISFYLKCGIFIKRVTVDIDKMALGLIKQLAISFVNEIYFNSQNYPEKTFVGDYIRKNFNSNDNIQKLIYDRLILRKYINSEQQQIDSFIPFNSVSDIEQDSYICIEVSEKPLMTSTSIINNTNNTTASASNTSHLLRGTQLATSQQFQQLINCSSSLSSTPNNNSQQQQYLSNSNNPAAINPNQQQQQQQQQQNMISNNNNNNDSNSNENGKVCHEFKPESFLRPTYCSVCDLLIKGVFRQGFQCHHCKKYFCPKCKQKSELLFDLCTAIRKQSNLVLSTLNHQQQNQNSTSSSSTTGSQQQQSTNYSSSSTTNDSGFNTSDSNNNNTKLDISTHPNMNKRKSASNLLHFNLVFPFKSSHGSSSSNNSQQQATNSPTSTASSSKDEHHQSKPPKTPKSSGGALDPVLQQLGKLRMSTTTAGTSAQSELENQNHKKQNEANQQKQQQVGINININNNNNNNNLMVTQASHLSSSHQNLYTNTRMIDDNNLSQIKMSYADESLLLIDKTNNSNIKSDLNNQSSSNSGHCSASAHQSPVGGSPTITIGSAQKDGGVSQLSNSARASAHDIHNYYNNNNNHHHYHHQMMMISPTKRDQTNHTFLDLKEFTELDLLCDVCRKVLKNSNNISSNQRPFVCKTCKLRVHSQCQRLVLADCMSRVADQSRQAAEKKLSSSRDIKDSISSTNNKDSNFSGGNEENNNNGDKQNLKNSNSNVSRDGNIRLHRLTPSVKHIKRPDSTKPIIEGWLKHTTLSDEQARKHYWRLDETDITLYENDTSKRYFKAISLNKITRVVSAESLPKVVKQDILSSNVLMNDNNFEQQQSTKAKSANTSPAKSSTELKAQMKAMFAFELATGSMYLVQADSETEANRWKEQLDAITKKKKKNDDEKQELLSSPNSNITSTNKITTNSTLDEKNSDVSASKKDDNVETSSPISLKTVDEKIQKQPEQETILEEKKLILTSDQKNIIKEQQPASSRPQRQHHHRYPPSIGGGHHYRSGNQQLQQHKTYTDPNRSRLYNRPRITIKIDSFNIPDHLIEGKYLIERDRIKGVGFEELGSGQFGKVYAAISEWKGENPEKGLWSGVPVAIKEISKARFDLRQQAKLKNEANILSRLDHPGVIILERVHDLPDKIYIVMEQLEDDMLEMIVSTEEKRLNERITKFLTYQILEALKYLHAQNIAHCDLKPENVLLVERRSQFPQIKLCDFGFAKIIEENSFRSSLVGTPAYLAPEVVKGERYNRSVDLWSVGVIVYVSLSGEFPFNEGENIHDQISRANFMYPDQPWAKISTKAKNFINSLLRVNCEKRLSANRAQMDDWLQDYQLWCDLCELEVRVGKRWVTDDADYERWSRYAKEHNLQIPRSATQLHEDLLAD